jgi:hypothetical protein
MSTATATRERPILFSGPMVRAILDGRKTQTRRIIKPQPVCEREGSYFLPKPCPYGRPGDRLWVRETWAPVCTFDPSPETGALYRADPMYDGMEQFDWPWTPSIHMPRWASRITLEITGVRVERLNEISNSDCISEGLEPVGPEAVCEGDGTKVQVARYGDCTSTARHLFSALWDSINGAGSWAANPWVWVVEFRRVMPDLLSPAT